MILCNPVSAALEMFKLKMATFENGQPEDFLRFIDNFKTGIYGISTITIAGWINFLLKMLRGEAL